jgi:hypothetical protein
MPDVDSLDALLDTEHPQHEQAKSMALMMVSGLLALKVFELMARFLYNMFNDPIMKRKLKAQLKSE